MRYVFVRRSGGVSEPAFAISLLLSVTEMLGTKSVSEIAIQTAEYDGSPLIKLTPKFSTDMAWLLKPELVQSVVLHMDVILQPLSSTCVLSLL